MTRRWLGIAGIGAAVVLGAWLRWTTIEETADLHPRGDAIEYEAVARAVVAGEGFVLPVGDAVYPPWHAIGFPALLAPYLAFVDDQPGAGVRVVLASALLAIAATGVAAWVAAGPVAGVAAALVLATMKVHVTSSRLVMSDVPASAAVAITGLLIVAWAGRRRAVDWVLVGVAAGLAATIRQTNLLVLAPALLMIALEHRRVYLAGALAVGVGLGLAPLLLHNTVVMGSPVRDGLDVWLAGPQFGWDLPRYRVDGGTADNLAFYTRLIAGDGTLYAWPVAALVLLGAVQGLRAGGRARDAAIVSLGFGAATLAIQLAFFAQSARYLVPMAPALAVLAGLACGTGSPASRLLCIALVAVALARGGLTRPQPLRDYGEVRALRQLAARIEPDAVVIAAAEPHLFEWTARVGADRVLVPLGIDKHTQMIGLQAITPVGVRRRGGGGWLRRPIAEGVDAARVARALDDLAREHRPLYLATVPGEQFRAFGTVLVAASSRFRLEPVDDLDGFRVYRLAPR